MFSAREYAMFFICMSWITRAWIQDYQYVQYMLDAIALNHYHLFVRYYFYHNILLCDYIFITILNTLSVGQGPTMVASSSQLMRRSWRYKAQP